MTAAQLEGSAWLPTNPPVALFAAAIITHRIQFIFDILETALQTLLRSPDTATHSGWTIIVAKQFLVPAFAGQLSDTAK